MARFLGGSDVDFGVPGHSVFVGPNLAPNKGAGPFGPDEQPGIFVMSVQPGRVYMPMPAKP
jgi:hypothetical protein